MSRCIPAPTQYHGRGTKWIDLETWSDRPDYLTANDGFGMCNTEFGTREGVFITCGLGGIGCNVNHTEIKRASENA